MLFHAAYALVGVMIHWLNIKISSSSKFWEEKHKNVKERELFLTVVREDFSDIWAETWLKWRRKPHEELEGESSRKREQRCGDPDVGTSFICITNRKGRQYSCKGMSKLETCISRRQLPHHRRPYRSCSGIRISFWVRAGYWRVLRVQTMWYLFEQKSLWRMAHSIREAGRWVRRVLEQSKWEMWYRSGSEK